MLAPNVCAVPKNAQSPHDASETWRRIKREPLCVWIIFFLYLCNNEPQRAVPARSWPSCSRDRNCSQFSLRVAFGIVLTWLVCASLTTTAVHIWHVPCVLFFALFLSSFLSFFGFSFLSFGIRTSRTICRIACKFIQSFHESWRIFVRFAISFKKYLHNSLLLATTSYDSFYFSHFANAMMTHCARVYCLLCGGWCVFVYFSRARHFHENCFDFCVHVRYARCFYLKKKKEKKNEIKVSAWYAVCHTAMMTKEIVRICRKTHSFLPSNARAKQ